MKNRKNEFIIFKMGFCLMTVIQILIIFLFENQKWRAYYMKNAIPFTVPFTGSAKLDFISCFASTYVYLEKIPLRSGNDKCAQYRGENCVSCGNCENSDPTYDLQPYYFLFDTMSGRSSLRLRFNGEQTEIQRHIGATAEDGCGTDYTFDFLFGFVGYEYKKLTATDSFKTAIVASVDAGNPVIAKVNGNNGRFRVITGYDGDELICPNFTNAQQRPDTTPSYDELDSLYIIGEKTIPRYTVKDGLRRICEVMEYNLTEGLMMDYVLHLGWYSNGKDGMGQVNADGRKARMQRVADTMWYTFNCYNFAQVFRAICDGKMVYNAISDMKKLQTPEIKDLCANIGGSYGYTHDLAWALIGLSERTQEHWNSNYACGWAEMVEMVLTQINSNDVAVFDSIKKIIDLLGK